jgi:signal transduction histidine kinase
VQQGHEVARVRAVRAYRILDTDAEPSYDALARLAASVCDAPIGLLALVDEERVWFKARFGLAGTLEIPRASAFCDHAIGGGGDVVEVGDARRDVRFADGALVAGFPHARFYAGAPLVTPEGDAVGVLCALDTQPRALTEAQREQLRVLAGIAVEQLERRKQLSRLADGLAKVAELTRVVLDVPARGTAVRSLVEAVGVAAGGRAAVFRRASDGTYGQVDGLDELPLPGGRAVVSSEPLRLQNAPEDELVLPIVGAAGAPDLVLAVRTGGRPPDGPDRAALQLVTAALAIAARNFALNGETERRRTELADARTIQAELVARLARDVRGPVTSIVGFARMLEDDPRFPPEAREALAMVRASGEHIGDIAADVELLSRIELAAVEPQWRSIDLAALALAAGAVLDAPVAEGRVVGDPDLVTTAFQRLIEDARRPGEPVRARLEDLGEAVVLELTGTGVPPAGDELAPTLGARLAMRIVERHRGTFRAGGSRASWWVRMTFPADPRQVDRRRRVRIVGGDAPAAEAAGENGPAAVRT